MRLIIIFVKLFFIIHPDAAHKLRFYGISCPVRLLKVFDEKFCDGSDTLVKLEPSAKERVKFLYLQ